MATSVAISTAVPGIYASLSCPAPAGWNTMAFLGLAGFMFTIPFALAFATLRNRPEKNIALVVAGLSVILAGLDLLLIVPQGIVVYITFAAGLAVMCAGEVFLAGDYMDYSAHRKRAKTAMRMSKRRQHNQE